MPDNNPNPDTTDKADGVTQISCRETYRHKHGVKACWHYMPDLSEEDLCSVLSALSAKAARKAKVVWTGRVSAAESFTIFFPAGK